MTIAKPALTQTAAHSSTNLGTNIGTGAGQANTSRISRVLPTFITNLLTWGGATDIRRPNDKRDINFNNRDHTLESLKWLSNTLNQTKSRFSPKSDDAHLYQQYENLAEYEYQEMMQDNRYAIPLEKQNALNELKKVSQLRPADTQLIEEVLNQPHSIAFFSAMLANATTVTPSKIKAYFDTVNDSFLLHPNTVTHKDITALMGQLPQLQKLDASEWDAYIDEISEFVSEHPEFLAIVVAGCAPDKHQSSLPTNDSTQGITQNTTQGTEQGTTQSTTHTQNNLVANGRLVRERLLSSIAEKCPLETISFLSAPEGMQTLSNLSENYDLAKSIHHLRADILNHNPNAFDAFWDTVHPDTAQAHMMDWIRDILALPDLDQQTAHMKRFVDMCNQHLVINSMFPSLFSTETPEALTDEEQRQVSGIFNTLYDTGIELFASKNNNNGNNNGNNNSINNSSHFYANPLFLTAIESLPPRRNPDSISARIILEKLCQNTSIEDLTNIKLFLPDLQAAMDMLSILYNKFDLTMNGQAGVSLLDFAIETLAETLDQPAPFSDKLAFLAGALSALDVITIKDIGSSNSAKLQAVKTLISKQLQGNFTQLMAQLPTLEHTLLSALCQTRHSPEEFAQWFKQSNANLKPDVLNRIQAGIPSIKDLVQSLEVPLSKKGFNFLHHNQVTALAAVEKLSDKNLFLTLGTGQGKTLVSALSAIIMLKQNPDMDRVYIFSSYEHLSKRDHERMAFLFNAAGIGSAYLGDPADISQLSKDKRIVFADSAAFCRSAEKCYLRAVSGNGEIPPSLHEVLDLSQSGVILDEGDLITLDDRGSHYLYDQSATFSLPRPTADLTNATKYKQALFPNDNTFFEQLDANFPGVFSEWFQTTMTEENIQAHGHEATNGANGQNITYAAPFGATLIREGKFEAGALNYNFLEHVRSCQKLLCLSGSIDASYSPAFKNVFKNQQENLFLDIPNFYGNHRRAQINKARRKEDNLNVSDWKSKILEDITQARALGQPAMVFVDPSDSAMSLEDWQNFLAEQFPDAQINNISKESDITDRNGEKVRAACRAGTITLATPICGRGVDFVMSRANQHGLHVTITALPKENNKRLLTQMEGRTGRMDKNGSYSIIVRGDYSAFEKNGENCKTESKVKDRKKQEILHTCALYYMNLLKARNISFASEAGERIARRWAQFGLLLNSPALWGGSNGRQPYDTETLKRFISSEVVKS